uniref:Glycosyltransferase n=1 Tax=Parastrongyloides trichosuri TaxID=131310 RepID=A0A0N4Z7M8_PARTI
MRYDMLNCSRLMDNDEEYIKNVTKNRLVYEETNLKMDCKSINSRGFTMTHDELSDIEKRYSLAYANNVYRNYEIIEMKLLMNYSPNNHYCYMVDKKSPNLLKKMLKLEKCLPNVYVSEKQYSMESNGINTNLGHYECMKILVDIKWDYLFILQNDDIAIKTNKEILEILEVMNFPIDVALVDPSPFIKNRVNQKISWKYRDLNIFLPDDRRLNDPKILDLEVVFQKGLVPSGFPYQTVYDLVYKLNITKFLLQLNTNRYGHDELGFQTLVTDDILNVTNYIPRSCINKYYPRSSYLSRKVIWYNGNCPSKMFYHIICVWGVEMLNQIPSYGEFFGYRFIDNKDYGALRCWIEYIYNKNKDNTDLWYYYNLPQSNLQRLRKTHSIKELCEV